MVKNTFTFHAFKIFYFTFLHFPNFFPQVIWWSYQLQSWDWSPHLFSFLLFFFFFFLIFYCKMFALQYCASFCHTSTWISHRYTYVPFSFLLWFWLYHPCANCILLSINTALKGCISFSEDFVKEHGRTFYFIIIIILISSKLLMMVFLCMLVYFTHPETVWKRGHIVIRLFA